MRFTRVKIVAITLFCLCASPTLFGQAGYEKDVKQTYEIIKTCYGTNPSLVNGRNFEDIYRNDLGHPYLGNDQFEDGHLVFRNTRFDTVRLKYNIYNQTLVILPSAEGNASTTIIPPNDFISEFSLRGELFHHLQFDNGKSGYYHKEYTGSELQILYAWSKKAYDSYHNTSFLALKFSDSQKKHYLVLHGVPYAFSSNKSFAKKFEQEYQKSILLFLKSKKINLKKPDPVSLEELGYFCNDLLSRGKGEITKSAL